MTSLALALAYLGTLAFIGWLLWLRGVSGALERRVNAALEAQLTRIKAVESRADPGDLDKRLTVLEHLADTSKLARSFGGR